jgi:PAS domain S-box-containing protein
VSLTEAQLQFAAEFVAIMVTASALALLLLRPEPRRFEVVDGQGVWSGTPAAQMFVAGLALAALAGAAFVHGSLILTGAHVEWIGLGRAVSAALVLVSFPYPGPRRSGRVAVGAVLLRLGFLAWLAAGLVELASGPLYATDALVATGSVVVAGALLRAARRSIAVRVAAGAAASLLLVVVVLALSLSTVISNRVENEELSRLSARAAVEKSIISDSSAVASDAQYVEVILAQGFPSSASNPLTQFATGTPAEQASAASAILAKLDGLPPAPGSGIVAYANPAGTTVLAAGTVVPASPGFFAQEPALSPPNCNQGRQGLYDISGSIYLAASSPECTPPGPGRTLLGVAIAAFPLSSPYLADRQKIDPAVSLALLSGRTVFSVSGISSKAAVALANRFHLAPDQSIARAVGDQFVSVAALTVPVGSGGRIPLRLVLSDQSNTVLTTRDQLFRTLFLIAFGGTVLALGLAIFTGDRITAGLRRLTRAAAGIAGGDTSVRAGVGGDDEVAALGTAFDAMVDSVTAQSAALQAAADDEARLRNRLQAVVAGMSDALIAVDSYGRITDFNQAAVELTGVDAGTALGSPAAQVIRLQTEDGVPVTRELLLAGRRGAAVLARVVREGVDIPVAVSSGILRGPAREPVGTVLVVRDMRREQEVEQMKTEFLSRIGHELRTPLTGILGYADILLRREVAEERARAWHEEILHSARRLLRIVEMLEFFASEGAGRVVLRPEQVDVRALVNGIASSWSGRLPPNLTLGRRLPKEEVVLRADQRWLTLAVDELIDNAVKFSPEGGRIVIRVERTPDKVEISVADQGMGMTAQHYDVLFGEFVQGDSSDTRRFGGLGLGLAVVRRVVEGHGGTISCRSAPGRGATFVLGLPVWPDDGSDQGPGPDADGVAARDGIGAASPGARRGRLRRSRPSPTVRGGQS